MKTLPPDQLVQVASGDLRAMDVDQLVELATQLGIYIDKDTTKTALITQIISQAVEIEYQE